MGRCGGGGVVLLAPASANEGPSGGRSDAAYVRETQLVPVMLITQISEKRDLACDSSHGPDGSTYLDLHHSSVKES